MTQENKFRKFLTDFATNFVCTDIAGDWWAGEVNMGSLEDEFRDAELFLEQIALDAKREGMERAMDIAQGVLFRFWPHGENVAKAISIEKDKL